MTRAKSQYMPGDWYRVCPAIIKPDSTTWAGLVVSSTISVCQDVLVKGWGRHGGAHVSRELSWHHGRDSVSLIDARYMEGDWAEARGANQIKQSAGVLSSFCSVKLGDHPGAATSPYQRLALPLCPIMVHTDAWEILPSVRLSDLFPVNYSGRLTGSLVRDGRECPLVWSFAHLSPAVVDTGQ
ncbi:hypothetical protein RRG08_061365 [Elysia crispata]|uniref:Uncharacterized protein n=1 Tax=Elysia crispata TaxID=231223 RepID=A0AAE1AF69_9GAST|nr:hypothetical protein RRG08_061365 [Elysia crispata]